MVKLAAAPKLPELAIPPRPQAITDLLAEMRADEPDLGRVAAAIKSDVGLASGMLKAVNSPLFGLARRVSSVPQAVELLGLRRSGSIATGLAIRYAVKGGSTQSLERFWDTAEKTALLSDYLGRRIRGIVLDEAYTFGLFHDCGIPLLMRHFPRYKTTLRHANDAADEPFTAVEEREIGTHHGVVGFMLARSWQLPDAMCEAILRHHDTTLFADETVAPQTRDFVGVAQLADHVQQVTMRATEDIEWAKTGHLVLKHFGLTHEDYVNLVEDAQQALNGPES